MSVSRVSTIYFIAAFLIGYGCVASSAAAPNVLLIAIDDLRPELGCYGLDYVDSPNLDRLASQGVLFTNHFVQVPTCGASRYAMLTGRSPHRSGVSRGNNAFFQPPTAIDANELSASQSLPETFRRNGYHTACIGKISHTADGLVYAYDGTGDGRLEMPHAWTELATPLGSWQRGWGIFFAYQDGIHREDGGGHRDLMQFTAERDEELPDGLLAQAAIEKLREFKTRQQPFFLGLGFFKPHLPFVAPRQDWDAVQAADLPPIPSPTPANTAYWHRSGEFYNYDMPFAKSKPLAAPDAEHARRGYLACVRYTDRQVGKVLGELERTGLADSTIVIVWGDHGWFLGDSALWGKHAPLERAVRSALIVRHPEQATQGIKSSALVESIDLYPTLVDLCKLESPPTHHPLDGTSLGPLLRGEQPKVRDVSASYWKDAVSLRNQQHRLIFTGAIDSPQQVELYDVRTTPDPLENLADANPMVVRRMLDDYATRIGK